MKILIAFLLFGISTNSILGQKHSLTLNLKIGDIKYRKVSVEANLSQIVDEYKIENDVVYSFSTKFKVIEINDGVYTFETTIDSAIYKVYNNQYIKDSNGMEKKYTDLSKEISKLIVGKPFLVKINKYGMLLEINDLNLFNQPSVKNKEDSLVQQKLKRMKVLTKKFVNSKVFRSNFEIGTSIYTDSLIQIGDIWNTNSISESILSIHVETTNRLVEIKDSSFHIIGRTSLDNFNNIKVELDGANYIDYDMINGVNTDFFIDINSGWINKSTIEISSTGTAVMQNIPNKPNGLIVPIKANVRTTIIGN